MLLTDLRRELPADDSAPRELISMSWPNQLQGELTVSTACCGMEELKHLQPGGLRSSSQSKRSSDLDPLRCKNHATDVEPPEERTSSSEDERTAALGQGSDCECGRAEVGHRLGRA